MAPLAKRDDIGKLEAKTTETLNHKICLPIQISLPEENMQFLGILIIAIQIGFALRGNRHVLRAGEEAQKVFNQILTRSRQSPNYYRRAQKQWIDMAKQHV